MKKTIKFIVYYFPILALFYRNIRELLDQCHVAQQTPWGFSLCGHKAMANGSFEPDETKVVRRLLADIDVLVNVGANVGYYCCHALSMGKTVIAVEPNSRNLHYLLKNIENNGWAKLAEVFPIALGIGTNISQMWGGGTAGSLIKGWASIPESYVTLVPILSLDRILNNAIQGKRALILVDIEGAEYMMLQGATRTLVSEPSPIWMMEISSTEHHPSKEAINPHFAATFGLFFEAGYKAYTAKETAKEITAQTVQLVMQRELKLSTHNFLFTKANLSTYSREESM
jgi:FkbM family methyltransferase